MTPLFTILGARGSRPVCDPGVRVYGGNTTCFLLETEGGPVLIDAGTGLCRLAARPTVGKADPMTVLFTHFHLDHLAGLPSAPFLYRRSARVRLMADPGRRPTLREALSSLLTPPFWPLTLAQAGAVIEYGDLWSDGRPIGMHGVTITAMPLRHPQGCLGLCLAWPGFRVVIATDHEPGDAGIDAALTAFARQADVLLMDAQYQPEQRARRQGWGHGDWESAVHLAEAAGVGRLVLIHHDPNHDDAAIAAIEAAAQRVFPGTVAAREGMQFPCARETS